MVAFRKAILGYIQRSLKREGRHHPHHAKRRAVSLIPEKTLHEFERLLGYRFKDENLLTEALTHTTFAYESLDPQIKGNQRLEFLGDSILNMVIADELYRQHPDYSEGVLTKARSNIVNNNVLVERARLVNLSEYLLLGKGERKTGGKHNNANLSGAFEAVIGAIYLDGGISAARSFIREKVVP